MLYYLRKVGDRLKNVLIGQSGGPTAVINASLAGAMEYAFSCEEVGRVYGMVNGIKGALNENFMDLTAAFCGRSEKIEQLKYSPAMYLGSCRYKIAQDDERDCARMLEILDKHDIGYFLYIGGNDSMDTVLRLSRYGASAGSDIRFVGIPKTIDNDLPGIDHSPGFGSAAKFVSAVVKDVSYDTSIYAMKSVHIIETMGRNAGWLAAAGALARDEGHTAPHLIYMPEVAFSDGRFVEDVDACLQKHNSVIIVVSEGLRTENGEYVSAQSGNVDRFGHVMLCGTGQYLKHLVEENFGCKVRCLEIGVLQRSAGHFTSATDVEEAYRLGIAAAQAAVKNGQTGCFSTLTRLCSQPYLVRYGTEDVAVVANRERPVPRSWINARGNDVTPEMLEYLRPLVKGSPHLNEKNGLADYISIAHLDTNRI